MQIKIFSPSATPSPKKNIVLKSLFDKSRSKTLSYIILLRKHLPIMDFVNPKISLHIKTNPTLERVRVKWPSKSSLWMKDLRLPGNQVVSWFILHVPNSLALYVFDSECKTLHTCNPVRRDRRLAKPVAKAQHILSRGHSATYYEFVDGLAFWNLGLVSDADGFSWTEPNTLN